MLKSKIHQLYAGHQAIHANLNNETISEQLNRERSASDQKEKMNNWSKLAFGTTAMLPMFACDSNIAYLAAFMGSVLVATSVATLAEPPINKATDYLSEIISDITDFIANKEGVSIADIGKSVSYSNEDLVDMAIGKSRGILESKEVPGLSLYIEAKYSSFRMTDEQRKFFDNAVQSIKSDINYRVDSTQLNDLREALIESKTGNVIMTSHGFSEEIDGKLVALMGLEESCSLR